MVDPILGLPELSQGNPLNVTDQNDRNLVTAWFAAGGAVAANNLSTPPGTVLRGQAWIIAGTATGTWTGNAANTIAIALSDNPTSSRGWKFIPMRIGMTFTVIAGSPTGHLRWNGSSLVAV